MERVIVIGAGVGGLAAAVRLQNAGYQVALYEKEPQALAAREAASARRGSRSTWVRPTS